jgi:hypothetical protein
MRLRLMSRGTWVSKLTQDLVEFLTSITRCRHPRDLGMRYLQRPKAPNPRCPKIFHPCCLRTPAFTRGIVPVQHSKTGCQNGRASCGGISVPQSSDYFSPLLPSCTAL